jgi:hypothetical protein
MSVSVGAWLHWVGVTAQCSDEVHVLLLAELLLAMLLMIVRSLVELH